MDGYKALLYKYQTDLRGLKKTEDLIAAFARMQKCYKSGLKGFLPENLSAEILDLPCGYGNFLYFLKGEGYVNATGVDIDPRQVELAASIGLNAISGDGLIFLRDKKEKYDIISSLDFLEHLQKEELFDFLTLCHTALKSGGRLIVRTPCSDGPFGARDRYNDLTHEQGFTSGSLCNALRVIGFTETVILDERPRPYNFVNWFRLAAFKMFTILANGLLRLIGIGAPRIWTTSMWTVATKSQTI